MKTGRINKRNLIACLLTVSLLLASFLFFNSYQREVGASGVADSVIVQLKDEPAAVWKARQEKAGNAVSVEQLQAYRNSITEKQNAFLADLQARGISYEIEGVDINDFDGAKQMRADYRFNLVFNGVTLKVPGAAIETIKSMPQVKDVQQNGYDRVLLDKSVPYINAPAAYGQYPELTPFDTFNEGFEGQGIYIAVLDTGIDRLRRVWASRRRPPPLIQIKRWFIIFRFQAA
jgi:hypothetical protein